MIFILKHIGIEGPGTLGNFLRQARWDVRVVQLQNGEPLPALSDCEAVISLGGPMNVYQTDKFPFLEQEEEFLRKALQDQIPILGICLGAQILAKAAGARVRAAKQKEIGWFTVSLTEEGKHDGLFRGIKDDLKVFQWHEDTFDIPNNANLLATADTCKNQALRIGRCAWGVQFHPEMTADMIKEWVDFYQPDLDRREILSDYYRENDIYNQQAGIIYTNFAHIVKEAVSV
jgi:GMP synthase-like glutamine amidotransferase